MSLVLRILLTQSTSFRIDVVKLALRAFRTVNNRRARVDN